MNALQMMSLKKSDIASRYRISVTTSQLTPGGQDDLVDDVEDAVGRHDVTLQDERRLHRELIRVVARHAYVLLLNVLGPHPALDDTGADDVWQDVLPQHIYNN